MRVLLPVLLLGQGSDAMRNPTKPPRIPPKDPPKASLEDPEAAMRPRRLEEADPSSVKNKAELNKLLTEPPLNRQHSLRLKGKQNTPQLKALESLLNHMLHTCPQQDILKDCMATFIHDCDDMQCPAWLKQMLLDAPNNGLFGHWHNMQTLRCWSISTK